MTQLFGYFRSATGLTGLLDSRRRTVRYRINSLDEELGTENPVGSVFDQACSGSGTAPTIALAGVPNTSRSWTQPVTLRRFAWFVTLWCAGVLTVALVALAIRAALADPRPAPPAAAPRLHCRRI